MAPSLPAAEEINIPSLPSGSVKNFIPYLAKHPDTPIPELLEPYKKFEAELRKVYAQQPEHEIVKDGCVNLVPIFEGQEGELKIRARDLEGESEEERDRYIMPLKDEERKPSGAPAVVSSLKAFQQNFNLFSESALSELDWNNVVAAGSAVTTALLPVPEKWAGSKRSMREYYHQHLAPASDVDLFLYGLNEEEGLEKIKQIERNIKDSILHETTTIRTKNAITIASLYPTRHVQIVLRLYDSVSQIITGFDVDCACAAYDGKQVYAAPRAVTAFVTQCNTIDLTRRSPSYENRLSKYSHRGFEVHWPLMDRTRIDPTIFERSFGRTQGLARLLILEKLPKTHDRDSYMDQRRAERGRPAVNRGYRHSMSGNIKEQEEDEVAEWIDHEEVASYHTMTVPYGPTYHAARINRLLYAKDLLLNAEWNQPKEREVHLHRHPCFFGTAEEVLQDCCGYCPVPKTDEELQVAEEESKTYISGKLTFLQDDPGRQEIGSFNPITDDEWTTMAYVGDTARLCQAIVDGDLEHVQDWCAQEGVDVNRRDYTGRTPLHLAVMASTPEIVQCLIDNGARLIARLVDGRTALHIAAARGNATMVKALMDKSLENEEAEELKEEDRKEARKAKRIADGTAATPKEEEEEEDDDASSEASEITLDSEDDDKMTMGSFVKVEKDKVALDDGVPEDSSEEPDFYDVNVVAWDYGLTPLHLAILNGHLDIIELLVSEYGADVLLPVKLVQPGTTTARGAIMTIVLALALPSEKAKAVVSLLLELGATSAQADMNHFTALHYVIADNKPEVLDVLLAKDRPVALSVLDNIGSSTYGYQGDSPLLTAINKGYEEMVEKLLSIGAKPDISFEAWIKWYLTKNEWAKNQNHIINMNQYKSNVIQPIIAAAGNEKAKAILALLKNGADASQLDKTALNILENPQNARYQVAEALLDIVQKKIKALKEWKDPALNQLPEREQLKEEEYYTVGLTPGTYEYWSALSNFKTRQRSDKKHKEDIEKTKDLQKQEGTEEKKAAIAKLIVELEGVEKTIIEAGGKTFVQMHPDIPKYDRDSYPGYQMQPLKPHETDLTFHVPDLNNTSKKGYKQLFEAAWNGDLETIKSLTLGMWGEKRHPPLQIAVKDTQGFTAFSIAVLRGHYDLAKKIVEICATQYHKPDGSRQRWNVRPVDSDDEGSDDEEGLPIFSELVSDKFTVDNLGEVSNIVKSDVLPLSMIEWNCMPQRFGAEEDRDEEGVKSLLDHAVQMDDMRLFKFLIDLGAEQQVLLAEEEDDQKCYTISRNVFIDAIRLGRTAMLGEMIRATGVGIPLNELIKTSGIEIKSKPRYYQGLSVGGKKRADWAQAPGHYDQVIEEKIPPVLQAAHSGSLDSVEWFMSDSPLRRYKEFAEANKHDKRIKTLEEGSGFDKTIGTWLNENNKLILHGAILYNKHSEESPSKHLSLVRHLLSTDPNLLEQKSSEGWTPLQLAVFLQRPYLVSLLLSSGANVRHRDKAGRNMLHSSLTYARSNSGAKTSASALDEMLSLFPAQAIKEMALEKSTIHPGSLTPLALWLSSNNGSHKSPDILQILEKHGALGEALSLINGEGDLPLHVSIKAGLTSLTSYLLSLSPSLLYRENSTGRTPLEMAKEIYDAEIVGRPIEVGGFNYALFGGYNGSFNNGVMNMPASSFVKKEEEAMEGKKGVWNVCENMDLKLQKEGGKGRKRRLVGLGEANEVAKRVVRGMRAGGAQVVVNGGLVSTEVVRDVVSEWV